MQITKCDICKKRIGSNSNSIHVGIGSIFSNHFELCSSCGKPVIKLLKTKKLLKEDMTSKK